MNASTTFFLLSPHRVSQCDIIARNATVALTLLQQHQLYRRDPKRRRYPYLGRTMEVRAQCAHRADHQLEAEHYGRSHRELRCVRTHPHGALRQRRDRAACQGAIAVDTSKHQARNNRARGCKGP